MAWCVSWHVLAGQDHRSTTVRPSQAAQGKDAPSTFPPLGEFCNSINLELPCKWVGDALGSASTLPCSSPATAVLPVGQYHLTCLTALIPAGTPGAGGGNLSGSTARWFSESTWMIPLRSRCCEESWTSTWASLGRTSGQKLKMSSW